MNTKKIVVWLGVGVMSGLMFGTAAFANDGRRAEIRNGRSELRNDRRELYQDRQELRRDLRNGAPRSEIWSDRAEIRGDLRELNRDRWDLRRDRADSYNDWYRGSDGRSYRDSRYRSSWWDRFGYWR